MREGIHKPGQAEREMARRGRAHGQRTRVHLRHGFVQGSGLAWKGVSLGFVHWECIILCIGNVLSCTLECFILCIGNVYLVNWECERTFYKVCIEIYHVVLWV